MLKETTQVGDIVRAKDWRGRPVEGVVVFKNRRSALVCSATTRGSYKYSKLELISRTPADAELAEKYQELTLKYEVMKEAVRELAEKVKGLI